MTQTKARKNCSGSYVYLCAIGKPKSSSDFKMKTFYLFFLFLIFFQSSNCQITSKEFRLCIDNIGCSDSVLRISKQQLLKASKVNANFSWLTIRALTIYIGGGDVTVLNVKGDTIDEKSKKIFERLGPGNTVIIEVEGYNTSSQRIPWASLALIIRE